MMYTVVDDISPSIINYFSQNLPVQVFFQGFFVLNTIVFSLTLLYYVSNPDHESNRTYLDFYFSFVRGRLSLLLKPSVNSSNSSLPLLNNSDTSNQVESGITQLTSLANNLASITQLFGFTTIVIVVSFSFGIIINNLSDIFMDKQDIYHFGLKRNWAGVDDSNKYDSVSMYSDTDNKIKLRIFNKVFNPANNQDVTQEIKKEIYYTAKHQILANASWREYLVYSQSIVNLTQSICFSCWILILLAFWLSLLQ